MTLKLHIQTSINTHSKKKSDFGFRGQWSSQVQTPVPLRMNVSLYKRDGEYYKIFLFGFGITVFSKEKKIETVEVARRNSWE
jgi:hypothetical protein